MLVTIYFTKKFVGGLLDGISYPTSITFDNCRLAKMAKVYDATLRATSKEP